MNKFIILRDSEDRAMMLNISHIASISGQGETFRIYNSSGLSMVGLHVEDDSKEEFLQKFHSFLVKCEDSLIDITNDFHFKGKLFL